MIGPVDRRVAEACRARGTPRSIAPRASEAEICYNLDGSRVHYDADSGLLYFAASAHSAVPAIVGACLLGMGRHAAAERVPLDRHGYFSAAYRLHLGPEIATTVLVALRLGGLQISRAGGSGPDGD